jgi:hypothetical protein
MMSWMVSNAERHVGRDLDSRSRDWIDDGNLQRGLRDLPQWLRKSLAKANPTGCHSLIVSTDLC